MNLILENVQPKHITLIQELAKTLHFQVKEDSSTKKTKKRLTSEQREFVKDLKEALVQVDLHQQGKIELQSARDFLTEIRNEA
ncbi:MULTISPECIES: hypothetical protein [unclassified Arcicella]|uniref:hypothetical protein n=1 Tax=unclassified Arcicella TaxID=2644986 RepID=UPI00285C514D|nr:MULTISPECIES: hypothetical protein [unclassified Arcicella]MDR6563078.1 hypothetical protein [Arcicella sp. BE51]MDR6811771.1 hypothetical protein [Arcicella sp. BE140]MDR6823296.1 hypothetical protein [Arcicella sp. BE139]